MARFSERALKVICRLIVLFIGTLIRLFVSNRRLRDHTELAIPVRAHRVEMARSSKHCGVSLPARHLGNNDVEAAALRDIVV